MCHRIDPMRRFFLPILLAAMAAAGCTNFLVADIAVDQGHDLQLENFAKVSAGMSQDKVRDLLGPPHIRWGDAENENWIYYYQRLDSRTDDKATMQVVFSGDKVIESETLQQPAAAE